MLGQRQQPARNRVVVVSAPALNNRLKNRYSSRSERAGAAASSSVALATTDNMSSVGSARLAAINCWPYSYIREPASASESCDNAALREPPKSNCGSIA